MPTYAYVILVAGWLIWLTPFLRAKQSEKPAKQVDRRARSRPSMANRRWSQRRSRTGYVRTLPLRPPSYLHFLALRLARHRRSDYDLVAAAAFSFALYHRHGDPRAHRGPFAGFALWRAVRRIPATRPCLHPLLEIAGDTAAPSLIPCIYPAFRNPGVPSSQRGS